MLLSRASISSGKIFCPLELRIMVLLRPRMYRLLSSSSVPKSPVRSHPSSVKTSLVASGFCNNPSSRSRHVLVFRRVCRPVFLADTGFHDVEYPSGGSRDEFIPGSIADERGTFSHAVADGEGELDAVEEFFHFRVHGCASYDDFLETSAQCVNQFLADLPVYLSVEQGNAERPFHGLFVDDGLYDILVYLFNDKGTVIIRLGFTSSKAFIRIFGEGTFPNSVTCVPTAVAVRKSNAQPYACAKGRKESTLSPFFSSSVRMPKVTLPARLFPVSMTPLLNPVVPEV